MKMNIRVRMRNPWFWIGMSGVVMTAMGVRPDMFTSWDIVIQSIKDLFSNPFMLGSVIMAVVGVINDPTTAGFNDSSLAMTYDKPKEEK
jgi:phi LC3 family holin